MAIQLILGSAGSASGAGLQLEWQNLPPLPDPVGVAGAFAGTSGDALIVAGGANFPGKTPWEGGVKVWHNRVYVLEWLDGPWKTGGELARPAAYGVSVTLPEGVLCVGGSDAGIHSREVFLLHWDGEKIQRKDLPALPIPLANSCGALVGDAVYVAGGTEAPEAIVALKRFFRLRLKPEPRWEELQPWPGPARMLATAATSGDSFMLLGGTDLLVGPNGAPQRRYLKDAYSYAPAQGWKRLSEMPNPVVAAASPAPAISGGRLLVVGGDDGTYVDFEPRSKHPGFPKTILCYEIETDRWTVAGESPAPRATLPTAFWKEAWVFPSGEVKPGVRSPDVWSLQTR